MSEYQLIPVTLKKLAGGSVQTVDARTLHEFLKVEARFNDWIARRIAEYGFEEGRDFFPILEKKLENRGFWHGTKPPGPGICTDA